LTVRESREKKVGKGPGKFNSMWKRSTIGAGARKGGERRLGIIKRVG